MTMLVDLIFLALIVSFFIIGYKKGFTKALLSFLARIISFVAAFFVSRNLAPTVYESLLKTKVVSAIDAVITDGISMNDVSLEVSKVFDGMSEGLLKICNMLSISEASIQQNVQNGDFNLNASNMLEKAIAAPILTIICQFIIFAIVSFVISLVLNVVIRLVCKIVKLPVLRTADGILGGVLGLINGVLLAYAFSCILFVIATLSENSQVSELINSSYIIELFTNNNLFI